MDRSRLAGYQIVEFSSSVKDALQQIAERLAPHEEEILDRWISQQYETWQPPGLGREDLRNAFGKILRSILGCMGNREPYLCLSELEEAGTALAAIDFPFQALVISVHFLEESYMDFLLNPRSENTQGWLVGMDEFLHAALATIATAYFESFRNSLLGQAEVGRIVEEGLRARIPKRMDDLEVAHVYVSAHDYGQLGGDFVDAFEIDRQKTAFIVGDFTGHGLEAASDAFKLRAMFRAFIRENPDVADAAVRLNRVLETELSMDRFVTALAMTYHTGGRFSIVNCGHPYPVVCDPACRTLEVGGPALGVGAESEFTTVDIDVPPGGVLVAYTDGILEARNSSGMFGEERVLEAVKEASYLPAPAIAGSLVDRALRFAGGRFRDDVAVLVLKRLA